MKKESLCFHIKVLIHNTYRWHNVHNNFLSREEMKQKDLKKRKKNKRQKKKQRAIKKKRLTNLSFALNSPSKSTMVLVLDVKFPPKLEASLDAWENFMCVCVYMDLYLVLPYSSQVSPWLLLLSTTRWLYCVLFEGPVLLFLLIARCCRYFHHLIRLKETTLILNSYYLPRG